MSQYEYEGRDPSYAHDSSWHAEDPSYATQLEGSRYVDPNSEMQPGSSSFGETLEEFKMSAEMHAQNLQNSVLSIKHKTDHVRNELDSVQNLLEGMQVLARAKSKPREDGYGQTANSYSRSRYNPVNSKYKNNAFDMKLEKYKKTAEERKSQNRSSSNTGGNRGQVDAQNLRLINEKIHQLKTGFNNI